MTKSVVLKIYKRGTKEDANNYCPITLVQTFQRFWKCNSKLASLFLDKHNILKGSQFGYRKNKYKKAAIATIMENIIENLKNKIKYNCVVLGY
jgi:hypothetical protein